MSSALGKHTRLRTLQTKLFPFTTPAVFFHVSRLSYSCRIRALSRVSTPSLTCFLHLW
uniref:Uncharacterized protein n=1 Tax=Octopus bimaculoides TaxID=37653 RepID=A0A0L8FI99_OCTBM